jgi:hypothetical protein
MLPSATVAASSSVPAGSSSEPSAISAGASAEPTPDASLPQATPGETPTGSAGPGGWTEIGRGQLIGVAGNGDVVVTGGPPPEYRRYSSNGVLRASVGLGQSVFEFGGAVNLTVHPTDDSILYFRPNPGRAPRASRS